jgi:DNA-binding NarL/FixJ family response regulator
MDMAVGGDASALTPEISIMQWRERGYSNKQIAQVLDISVSHGGNPSAQRAPKTEIGGQAELVRYAIDRPDRRAGNSGIVQKYPN